MPTGIVTVEMGRAARTGPGAARRCPGCGHGDHEADAAFCKRCGAGMPAGEDLSPPFSRVEGQELPR